MNKGDMPSFQGPMEKAYEALKKSSANLKHMIIFSDGDPTAPSTQLMQQIVAARITTSTVLIAGHSGPETMISIAEQGKGRFYNVTSPSMLPQKRHFTASALISSRQKEQSLVEAVVIVSIYLDSAQRNPTKSDRSLFSS